VSRPEREQLIELRDLSREQVEPAPLALDQVAPQRYVLLHFSLALENGELIDSNFERQAAECRIGDGNLPQAFERHLLGLRAGEECSVLLAPDEAFGPLRNENIQRLPRFRFPADLPLESGLVVDFADQAGNTQAGVVRSFDSSSVEVDFNHPLAGRALCFRARIVAVASEPFAPESEAAGQPVKA